MEESDTRSLDILAVKKKFVILFYVANWCLSFKFSMPVYGVNNFTINCTLLFLFDNSANE